MARLTGLDVILFDLPAATSWLQRLNVLTYEPEHDLDDARSIVDRYFEEIVVKQGDRFTASLSLAQAGVPKSNLDCTLYTIGGVALLGDLRSGTVRVRNQTAEGSGVADRHRAPQLVSTELTIDGEFQINTASGVQNAELVRLASVGSLAAQTLAYSLAAGSVVVQGNAILERASHKMDRGEIQSYSASLRGTGAPSACSGHDLLTSALTGSGAVGYSFDSSGNAYSGSCVLTEVEMSIEDAAIIKIDVSAEVYGTPVATSS